jgi:hypothetical protein
MSLEDRFRRLTGLKEEMEAERREQEERWQKERERKIEEIHKFMNRYFPTIQKVCQAFAHATGWEYSEGESCDGADYAGASFNTPVDGYKTEFHGRLSLALYPPSRDTLWASRPEVDTSGGTGGGAIRAEAEAGKPYQDTYKDGYHFENAHGYGYEGQFATFATDISLKTLETMAADALEDAYRSFVQWCVDGYMDA